MGVVFVQLRLRLYSMTISIGPRALKKNEPYSVKLVAQMYNDICPSACTLCVRNSVRSYTGRNYFVIRFVLYLNLQISQSSESDCASHVSKHALCTLDMVPRQKHGLMHLFDSSRSACRHILHTLRAAVDSSADTTRSIRHRTRTP